MREFISTRGGAPPTSLEQALYQGLAPDGGLYMPRSLPRLSAAHLHGIHELTWQQRAAYLARELLGSSVEPGALDRLTMDALDFPLPLVPLTDRIHVLELFHGPTLAFKDVGARFLARLMGYFRGPEGNRITILTATSGDTGGAVAQAFLGFPDTRVVVLFPDGRVTPRQERQFSTLGGNVRAVAVQGDFDDCQRMAKEAFQDEATRRGASLSSANSINIGRLLPQVFYYFEAWAELLRKRPSSTSGMLFSVPSGNFGNLTAGLMARAMGLPLVRFLAATNANDGVPRYLEDGRFEPAPSIPTLSTAMDVGDPSNLGRILHLYDGSLRRLRRDLLARSVSDDETRTCIRRVYDETGYVLDPHSAVGFAALEAVQRSGASEEGVLLATAHPAKFAEVVEPVLGSPLPVPTELARCLDRPRRVIPLAPNLEALRELLLEE